MPFESARIEYWFGTRSWAEDASDGFVGISAFWAGIQTDPGSLAVNRQVAAINTHVIYQLAHNESLVPGQLTSAGAERLAAAIGGQLPGLVEVGFQRGAVSPEEWGSVSREPTQLWDDAIAPYVEGKIATAHVARDWVRVVLTAAASEDAGRTALQGAVLDYQTRTLDAAASGSASAGAALDALVSAWGAVDGASVSADEVRQYLRDQQTRAGLDAARAVVDTGVALSPISPMASIGVDAGLEYMQTFAESQLTGGELPPGAAQSLIPDGVASLDEFFRVSVTEYRRLGLWDRSGAHAGDTASEGADDISADLIGDYEDAVDAMRATSGDHTRSRS